MRKLKPDNSGDTFAQQGRFPRYLKIPLVRLPPPGILQDPLEVKRRGIMNVQNSTEDFKCVSEL